jgi:hypothetical protein
MGVLIGFPHESKSRAAPDEVETAIMFGAEKQYERDSYGTHCSYHVRKPTLKFVPMRNQAGCRVKLGGGSRAIAIQCQA